MSNFQVRVIKQVEVEIRYETASWYKRVRLEPGVYPMRQDNFGSNNFFVAYVPGTVVASAFPSSFGGANFGDGNIDKEVGRRADYGIAYKDGDFWDGSKSRKDGAILIEEVI